MNVGQLKKLLEEYPDSTPVMVWNGFVGDVQPTKRTVAANLYKLKFDDYVRYCKMDRGISSDAEISQEHLDDLKESYKKHYSYELNEIVDQDAMYAKQFNKKKILIIEPGIAGKRSDDRLGGLEY